MCGIAGYIGRRKIAPGTLQQTLGAMDHRGPDHQAHVHFDAGNNHIHFLHSRLSIIDLDERANQPFSLGDYTIIFNGEIYNYVELKKDLSAKKIAFRTESDTEVLLQYYIFYGDKCVDHFEGMWAFAIYDKRLNKVFCSRDRFAEKPLYYFETPDGFYFGSEIKFLKLLSGRSFKVNQRHLLRYLINGYKSLYKVQETYFEGVKELSYATNLCVDADLKKTFHRYWQPKIQPTTMSLQEAINGTRRRLLESMKIRLRSDVPLAFCLSGGVDSAAIASIARKIFNYDVATFSIIDEDPRYNELANIQATVEDLKCPNTLIHISRQGAVERLKKSVAYHDGPLSTISYYVHSFLSEAIAAKGYKVACSGTGADELFTGYYDHFNLYLQEMRHSPQYPEHLGHWQEHIQSFIRNPYLKDAELYADPVKARAHIHAEQDLFKDFLHTEFNEEMKEAQYCGSILRNRMLNEMFHDVVPVILHEDDLNSMFYSVENRSPYLDTKLFDLAMSIPIECLIQKGFGKYILREAVKGMLNDKVRLDRQKKGFNASINSIIDFNDPKSREYLLEDSPVFKIVKREKIKALMDQNKGAFANHDSKFLFNFINTKIFVELNG
ncbi:MAG: asparagine synthase (glutamine-hydrolyzing) [Candidatus Omnitrophota bacterium]|nr:asparagine synthase (glutamine-hydrolyzing) [Candidatus Omnitrophota bacterium]